MSPLSLAIQGASSTIALKLLARGANPNLMDNYGYLAIHYAGLVITEGSDKVMAALLAAGNGQPIVRAQYKVRTITRIGREVAQPAVPNTCWFLSVLLSHPKTGHTQRTNDSGEVRCSHLRHSSCWTISGYSPIRFDPKALQSVRASIHDFSSGI